MPFPQRVREALAETDCSGLSGVPALDRVCTGAKFHSPTPLLLHEVRLGEGPEQTVWLCGTCCDNLSVLRHLLVQNDGDLPWAVRREFGNLIRAIALREWTATSPSDEDEDEEASG